jgi:hemoglobin-like flavoprotein
MFGLDSFDDPYSEKVLTKTEFIVKAQNIISMFDVTLSMLGPDLELLTEILKDVSKRHEQFGVTKEMFYQMEYCLLDTIEELVGGTGRFTSTNKVAFQQTYRALLADMQRFQRNK